jgi:outer membrane lipoprotein-sorting protein
VCDWKRLARKDAGSPLAFGRGDYSFTIALVRYDCATVISLKLLAYFLAASSLAAAELPDALTLLAQSRSAVLGLRSMRMDVSIVTTTNMPKGPGPIQFTASTAIARPNRLRLELKSIYPRTEYLMVSDGAATFASFSRTRSWARSEAVPNLEAISQTFTQNPFSQLPDLKVAEGESATVREEPVVIKGVAYPCWVVETKLKAMPLPSSPGSAITGGLITYWISQATKLTLQTSASVDLFHKAGYIANFSSKMTPKALVVDGELPEALFRFLPPKGYEHVDEVEMPGLPKPKLVGGAAPAMDGAPSGKALLFFFRVPSCGPCDGVQTLLDRLKPELEAKGILVWEPPASARESYEVLSFPTLVLVSGGGVREYRSGALDEAELRTLLLK